jgi:ribosomal protein S6
MPKKREPEEMDIEDSAAEEGSIRVYELGFHLDPELSIEEVKKAYQSVRNLILKEKGSVVSESEPQMIQLAYTISRQETAGRRDFDSAYFSWIAYEMPVENHAAILTAAAAEKRIIRFIDLVTTKEAARHAAELREIVVKTADRFQEVPAEADIELDVALSNVAP